MRPARSGVRWVLALDKLTRRGWRVCFPLNGLRRTVRGSRPCLRFNKLEAPPMRLARYAIAIPFGASSWRSPEALRDAAAAIPRSGKSLESLIIVATVKIRPRRVIRWPVITIVKRRRSDHRTHRKRDDRRGNPDRGAENAERPSQRKRRARRVIILRLRRRERRRGKPAGQHGRDSHMTKMHKPLGTGSNSIARPAQPRQRVRTPPGLGGWRRTTAIIA
jgi:hypothetical protein